MRGFPLSSRGISFWPAHIPEKQSVFTFSQIQRTVFCPMARKPKALAFMINGLGKHARFPCLSLPLSLTADYHPQPALPSAVHFAQACPILLMNIQQSFPERCLLMGALSNEEQSDLFSFSEVAGEIFPRTDYGSRMVGICCFGVGLLVGFLTSLGLRIRKRVWS